MRFLGLGLEDRVPDARTIWLFREKLTTAGAIKTLFERSDAMLRQVGYIAIRCQPDCRAAIKQGRIPQDWKDKPAKLRQKHAMRAGRSSSPRPSHARTVQCRRSILRFRCSDIRTTSRSIAALASSAYGQRQTWLPMRAAICAKACLTRPTRQAPSRSSRDSFQKHSSAQWDAGWRAAGGNEPNKSLFTRVGVS
jgi:hypothetical protein